MNLLRFRVLMIDAFPSPVPFSQKRLCCWLHRPKYAALAPAPPPPLIVLPSSPPSAALWLQQRSPPRALLMSPSLHFCSPAPCSCAPGIPGPKHHVLVCVS